jgi:hypothetical protein
VFFLDIPLYRTFPTLLLRRFLTLLRVCETNQCVCERSKPVLLKSVWKCELPGFDCLCRLVMRGLHYGQELVSTNRPDTFAQTKPPRQRFCLQSGGGPYNFHGLLYSCAKLKSPKSCFRLTENSDPNPAGRWSLSCERSIAQQISQVMAVGAAYTQDAAIRQGDHAVSIGK